MLISLSEIAYDGVSLPSFRGDYAFFYECREEIYGIHHTDKITGYPNGHLTYMRYGRVRSHAYSIPYRFFVTQFLRRLILPSMLAQ